MKILIVGPGAMGCLFSARLLIAGYDVTLLDHNSKRADKIARQGIIVQGISGNYTAGVPVLSKPSDMRPDFIFICVKSGKTGEAAESVKDVITENTLVVTLQNGLGNVEILKNIFSDNRVIGGITSEGATSLGEGKIRHAGKGNTILGPQKDLGDPLNIIVEALNNAGFSASSTDNVDDLIWGKLIINAGINALTAITGLKNGRLPEYEDSFSIMKHAVEEAVSVSKAKNINLPYDDPFGKVLEVCRDTSGNIASMLQDVLNKRNTEIDFINGAICREGKNLAIPTPVNQTLTSLIKAIESSYDERLFHP
ncbi:ketopantoate reductase family protein [Thermodesulfobacteriota bacterium]